MNYVTTCNKCNHKFSSVQKLEKHKQRKYTCDRIISCNKCDKKFKSTGDLRRHKNRKTSCEPIQGNPLKKTPVNTCHFCYKKLASKQSLMRHFNTCDIKNGGMNLLFKKVQSLTDEVKALRIENKKMKEHTNIINVDNNNAGGNIYNNSPHNNTTLNIQLMGYDSEQHIDFLSDVLKKALPGILSLPVREDIPYIVQIQNRIQQIVTTCYRNAEHKEMQNVYVMDETLIKENAFVYQEGIWKLKDWEKLGVELIQKIRMHASTIKNKDDILKVMKHIMILAGSNVPVIERMTESQIQELYKDMGGKLKFNTIVV